MITQFTSESGRTATHPADRIFQSLLPVIEEKVATWVEDAVNAGCHYVKASGGNGGVILFKNSEGKQIQRTLRFQQAYRNAGYFRQPFVQIADYALKCALKDSRMKEWNAQERWASVNRKRPASILQDV